MTRRTTIDQLSKKDRDILHQLHNLRFVTMEQLRMISGYGKSYTFAKAREYQRVGAVARKEIVGKSFYKNKDRQGIYMYVKQKGMNLLEKHGYPTTSTAKENRNAKADRILAILQTNEVVLELLPYGWKFLDGRDAKRGRTDFQNAILHGSLQSPDGSMEYGFYMLMGENNEETIKTIKNQTPKITGLANYLIVTRSVRAAKPAMEQLEQETVRKHVPNIPKLHVGGKLRVFPAGFARAYLTISEDNPGIHEKFLERLGVELLQENQHVDDTRALAKYQLDEVVRHPEYPGEIFYLANLLDNDLSQIRAVKAYNKDRYEEYGRRVLILTTNATFHDEVHSQLLDGPHYVLHYIHPQQIIDAKEALHPDVVVPDRTLKHQGRNKA